MDVHALLDIGSPAEAQRVFAAAILAASGVPPRPEALAEFDHWWHMGHVIDGLLQGRMLLRCIDGQPSIESLGELDP